MNKTIKNNVKAKALPFLDKIRSIKFRDTSATKAEKNNKAILKPNTLCSDPKKLDRKVAGFHQVNATGLRTQRGSDNSRMNGHAYAYRHPRGTGRFADKRDDSLGNRIGQPPLL